VSAAPGQRANRRVAASPAADPTFARLSAICLALPETAQAWRASHAEFRVRSKVFAYYLHDHHGDGIVSVSCRTVRGENRNWVAADPSRFYLPAYIGPRGWVGLRLDISPLDWQQVAEFVLESYRLAAPKRLAAMAGNIRPPTAPL
jgi:predicted DNA-binding protein (MmcQ/YjbR family)